MLVIFHSIHFFVIELFINLYMYLIHSRSHSIKQYKAEIIESIWSCPSCAEKTESTSLEISIIIPTGNS